MNYVRYGATVLALLTSVGVAAAQTNQRPSNAPMQAPSAAPQSGAGASQSSLQLSAQQKTAIFQAVTKEKVKTPPPADFRPSLGASVPASIELYTLPANAVADAPAAKQFKYTVAQNQVVIVDPTNMKVIDIIRQ
jgi:Protein of unknown function (DUF1236)